MEKLIIAYSIVSGGDGSASIIYMESEELAQWDQDHMDEGWGEDCSGTFELESETKITPLFEIETKESYYLDLLTGYDQSKKEMNEFKEQFFPKGPPVFIVEPGDNSNYNVYIIVDGVKKLVKDLFSYPEKNPTLKKAKELENDLNKG